MLLPDTAWQNVGSLNTLRIKGLEARSAWQCVEDAKTGNKTPTHRKRL